MDSNPGLGTPEPPPTPRHLATLRGPRKSHVPGPVCRGLM